ncbi:MAG TPA: preprotein translocase subunit SecE [Candidatus Hydrothermia bacterium]|nr:preprotein translocase subunit SecE [Candidatus Hydrothermae bacterium]MDD3648911.1 preprotein translocase subunit SecE [Candidatus Hydrothermia bacterium]MDD5572605.1 preprotein translocase subunit SecE [Candidatus Hydrothermia bacterium]HOK23152.1 preprotein translocase subunit SecE [Candidatus Hydrothermia bacterium]HOL23856.1 preprotein translocase subunit SecE [Candidatus Hydrothermia bacterium]
MKKLINFLKESYQEFKRITWPTKESLWGGTLGVVLISLFFILFMFLIDFLVSKIIQLILG